MDQPTYSPNDQSSALTGSDWSVMAISPKVVNSLLLQLAAKGPIVDFEDDPHLASLATCVGLRQEMGDQRSDRLSPYFNVELTKEGANPWSSEIVQIEGKIGIRFWTESPNNLLPRHPDLRHILHRSSINLKGQLDQIVIVPSDVYRAYQAKGLTLVVVTDWFIKAVEAASEQGGAHYLVSNEWEIREVTAQIQVNMMLENQVAFSGTHDVADHLLGGEAQFDPSRKALLHSAKEIFDTMFKGGRIPSACERKIAYAIGILLDDMAQPKWYHSDAHKKLLMWALEHLQARIDSPSPGLCTKQTLSMPARFHSCIRSLRDGSSLDANESQLEAQWAQALSEMKPQ